MFEIGLGEEGVVVFQGRLDATQCDQALEFLESLDAPSVFDFAALEYISSAGLGVLLAMQKKAMASGSGLKLINVNSHINDIFRFSGFDQIFEIETA